MKIVKLEAVERLKYNYRHNDYTMGLRWKLKDDYINGTVGMCNDIIWAVNFHGFEQVGDIGVGMYYIIDLEHPSISSIDDCTDFMGFMALYKDTFMKRKLRNRNENIDNIIDEAS